jgi:hypothetical protein
VPEEAPPEVEVIPVGGIHLSVSDVDPAIGFGYGVWERMAAGRFLIGADDVTFEGGDTGGSADITPAGTVSAPTFTGVAITAVINHTHGVSVTDPGHNHTQNSHNHTQNSFAPRILNSGTAGTVGVQGASAASNANASNAATTATNQAATATNNSNTTGISATTANPAGGVNSITPTGTVSAPSFTGQAHTNLPPYMAVFMWVRTS